VSQQPSAEESRAILDKWSRVRSEIEPRLDATVSKLEMAGVEGLASYIVKGGKMFRGFMTVLFAEAVGGDPKKAEDAAIAIELVQGASLALDDIVDKDAQRRGGPSAWILYGIGKSAMVSLLLVPTALKLVERYGPLALSYSISAWESIVRGEIMDAYSALSIKPAEYLTLASLKTGSLFSLAAALGVIAGGHEDLAEGAWNYGNSVGTAYQVADDITDFANYLKGAKQKLDPSEKLFVEWARSELNARDDTEIVWQGIRYLHDLVEKSTKVLGFLPPSQASKMIAVIPTFIISKMLESAGLSFDEGAVNLKA
jgi:geranylgeranyl pyrophosphate synthase